VEQSCPNSEELREFSLGRGELTHFDELADHVEGCADCQQRLAAWDGSTDLLIDRLSLLHGDSHNNDNGDDRWS
jgi:hypothetical protein